MTPVLLIISLFALAETVRDVVHATLESKGEERQPKQQKSNLGNMLRMMDFDTIQESKGLTGASDALDRDRGNPFLPEGRSLKELDPFDRESALEGLPEPVAEREPCPADCTHHCWTVWRHCSEYTCENPSCNPKTFTGRKFVIKWIKPMAAMFYAMICDDPITGSKPYGGPKQFYSRAGPDDKYHNITHPQSWQTTSEWLRNGWRGGPVEWLHCPQ